VAVKVVIMPLLTAVVTATEDDGTTEDIHLSLL
jgi:hypothetical protein